MENPDPRFLRHLKKNLSELRYEICVTFFDVAKLLIIQILGQRIEDACARGLEDLSPRHGQQGLCSQTGKYWMILQF